jgi:hypothetical protein
VMYGDAQTLSGFVSGGGNTLDGGAFGSNTMYGDGQQMPASGPMRSDGPSIPVSHLSHSNRISLELSGRRAALAPSPRMAGQVGHVGQPRPHPPDGRQFHAPPDHLRTR